MVGCLFFDGTGVIGYGDFDGWELCEVIECETDLGFSTRVGIVRPQTYEMFRPFGF